MCAVLWHWVVDHLDRILALVAIVISTIAILDVRSLLKELRRAVLKELLTHTASFAAFFRAAQFVDFYENQPDKETAIAMLMSFRLQQLLAPDATHWEQAELRKKTRETMEETSKEYAKLLISLQIAKLKDGWKLADD